MRHSFTCGLLCLFTALLGGTLATIPRALASQPPGTGSFVDGDLWVDVAGQSLPTCDTLLGTANLGYETVTVWRYSGYYHSWQYAPPGTHVTLSLGFGAGSGGHDALWSNNTDPPSAASVVASVGANGVAAANFEGIADVADRDVYYYADAGTKQKNRSETTGSGGTRATLWHSPFPSAMSHVCVVYPREREHVYPAGFSPAWDGELHGPSFTPDLHHRFRLLCQLYDENGALIWLSDPSAYPPPPGSTDVCLDEFTQLDQHFHDVTPRGIDPIPDLSFFLDANLLLVTTIQESTYQINATWTSWATITDPVYHMDVKAERLIYVGP